MKESKRNTIIVWLLLLGAVAAISLALPREGVKHVPDYTVGRPWFHADFISKYEIPVEPDEQYIKRVTDSVNAAFVPKFKLDDKVDDQQRVLLSKALNDNPDVSSATGQSLIQALTTLYDNGIVEDSVADMVRAGKEISVRDPHNPQALITAATHVRTKREAYMWLADSLAAGDTSIRAALQTLQMNQYLLPNLLLDDKMNQDLLSTAIQKALTSHDYGIIYAGQQIVAQGEVVTPHIDAMLKTYEKRLEMDNAKTNWSVNWIGQILLVAMIILTLYFFMKVIRPHSFALLRRMVFLILFITVFVVAVLLTVRYRQHFVYLIPFAVVPIIVCAFYDTRTAFFAHMVVILISALAVEDQSGLIIMQFLAGNIAIVSMRELTKRSQLIRTSGLIFITYTISYLAVALAHDGQIDIGDRIVIFFFLINCVVLSFAYFLIFVVEKLFGFTSTVTLVELSDINNPTLRMLSQECPGTFHHSLQVANLAALAALKIGASQQLARAGALYHDIGKSKNPAFFTENQTGENPHDHLSRPEDSAKIVIDHVANGLKIADEANLPQVIKDIIAQHHGTGVARYFYSKACKMRPGETVDTAPFTYPGPNPQTKEAAIIMLADSCEAAAKSLTDHSEEKISNLVEAIIDSKIDEGLLRESPLGFKEVEIIKQLFVERLRTFYHTRVSYPDDVNLKKESDNLPVETSQEA